MGPSRLACVVPVVVHDFLNHEVVPMGLTYWLEVTVIPASLPGSSSSLRGSSKNRGTPGDDR
jgi:hypothetical protein